MTFHARPRFTKDLDVWVEPTADNGVRVFGALAAFGAPLAAHGVTAQDFAKAGTIYQIGVPPTRIDILTLACLRVLPGASAADALAALDRWAELLRAVDRDDGPPIGREAIAEVGWYILHVTDTPPRTCTWRSRSTCNDPRRRS